MKRAWIVGAFALVAILGVVAVGRFTSSGETKRAVTLVVMPGWSATQIAEELERLGVVDSAFAFRLYMRIDGLSGKVLAGEYQMRTNLAYSKAAEILKAGPFLEAVALTIPEGLTLEQTAARVGEKTHVPVDAFQAAATPATVKPQILPDGIGTLEGFLYPETYFVLERETAADLVTRLVEQFETETIDVNWEGASSLGVSPFQVLIIASMIEEESKVDEERRKVSAVIYNRLERGMKLEIDATVQYAVKNYDGSPLTAAEIAVDSPYNTRRYPGIPPGPISSPRLASIEAALDPAATNDLFYVLTPDCRTHFFTPNFSEFERAKRNLRDC